MAAPSGARLGVTDPISLAPPTALDRTLSDALEADLRQRGLYESNEEALHREEARAHGGRAASVSLHGCEEVTPTRTHSFPSFRRLLVV
jgi:hypothetical protein